MKIKDICGGSFGRTARWLSAVFAFACAFVGVASAQQTPVFTPQFEVSAVYSYVRANPANLNGHFNLNGGSGSFAYNFSDRFAAVADVGAYRFASLPNGLDSTMYTYLFGPRYSFRKFSRVTPYAHILLGAGRLNASANSLDAGENSFAMAAGGGVDLRFRSHIAIRVIQAEYLMTRFAGVSGASATQNDLRISAGLALRFGSR